MMKTFTMATVLATLSSVEAKEHYVVKEDVMTLEHKRPRVETTTEKCAYDKTSFKLCGTYGASAKIGWEWEQEYYSLTEATKYYQLNLDLYSKQGLDLEGDLFADRLFSNQTSIILDEFKGLLTIQWKHWYANTRSCIAVFYAVDDLVFEIQMRLRFLEASKNIIEHLWTLDNWDSPYAVWLDDFGLSDYTPIEIYKREINQVNSETVLFGTIDDEATNCIPGTFTLGFDSLSDSSYNPVSAMINKAVQNVQGYMINKYGTGTIASGTIL